MATDSFILLNISAGIMEEKGKDPMPYACCCNAPKITAAMAV